MSEEKFNIDDWEEIDYEEFLDLDAEEHMKMIYPYIVKYYKRKQKLPIVVEKNGWSFEVDKDGITWFGETEGFGEARIEAMEEAIKKWKELQK